jgi:hypothetical protein
MHQRERSITDRGGDPQTFSARTLRILDVSEVAVDEGTCIEQRATTLVVPDLLREVVSELRVCVRRGPVAGAPLELGEV